MMTESTPPVPPPNFIQPTALVTGAASGVGAACAQALHARGYTVYAGIRTTEQRAVIPTGLVPVLLDITDEQHMAHGIATILRQSNTIDVVVHAAGYGLAGAIEETTIDEARHIFDTNVFGAIRLLHRILPMMRQQHGGKIIIIGSLAAQVALPFQGLYSASKAALGNLTEAVRYEVAPFGITVALIEPGDLATGFTTRRRWAQQAQRTESAYQPHAQVAIKRMIDDEQQGPSAQVVAQQLMKIIAHADPALRHTAGKLWQRFGVAMRPFMPQRWYEKIVRQHFRLTRKADR